MAQAPRHERAVVLGASMAGMAAARALSPHFEQVVLVEKDVLPRDVPAHRRGAPQSWHTHNLILRGQLELERLFPGYRERALSLGAVEIDHGLEVARCTELGWQPLFESGFRGLCGTRVLLEFVQRSLFLEQVHNVTLLEQTRVTEPIIERHGDGVRFTGVRTDCDEPAWQRIDADLVVDCTGRGTRFRKWFAAAGLPEVERTVVDANCGYSSRFYRIEGAEQLPWRGMIVDTVFPHAPRWGVLTPAEDGIWVVTLGAIGGDFPPSDDAGFLEFAQRLNSPQLAHVLERAEPVTPVRTFRRMAMCWNHFERYQGNVQGFLALGDSLWAYNPLYGQGMTVSVVSAGALLDELEEDTTLDTIAPRFYRRAARFAEGPWRATALRDLRWKTTVGARPWHAFVSVPLSELVLKAAHYDTKMFTEVLKVGHLVKQPYQLFTPRVVASIARYTLQKIFRVSLPRHDSLQLPQGG